MKKPKAISLFSGGLDSRLATLLIARQQVEVTVLHCITGFEQMKGLEEKRRSGRTFCRQFGLDYREISVEDEFLDIIQEPRHGWGKNLNPCVDCKILMLQQAQSLMGEIGADFVVSGEVLGQRPMSQHGPTLRLIEQESGLEGLLVRPLSAHLLTSTIPEENGWIDRERLEGFSGRSRKPQMQLAREIGLGEYPTPAGGCLLTDPRFSDKLKDIMVRGHLSRHEVDLLKLGRHFRLSDQAKLVVARDEQEAGLLQEWLGEGDWMFYPENRKGPLAIGRGALSETERLIGARLVGFYSRYSAGVPRVVVVVSPDGNKQPVAITPLLPDELEVRRL